MVTHFTRGSKVSATHLKIERPQILSTGARSSNDWQRFNCMIWYQDSSPNNGRHATYPIYRSPSGRHFGLTEDTFRSLLVKNDFIMLQPNSSECTLQAVWHRAFVIGWSKNMLGNASVAMNSGLTWPIGISTVLPRPMTVLMHNPNGRLSHNDFPQRWAAQMTSMRSNVITTNCWFYSNISQIFLLHKP